MNLKDKKLKAIKDEIIACQNCPLSTYRKENNFYPVIGEGNHNAEIMFIGEAPGLQEAKKARPFCGKAGKVLDELLDYIGIKRRDVYITNILKDRPPQNRDPLAEEVESCVPFLEEQIKIIKPKVITALGRHAMNFLMKRFGLEDKIEPISRSHGRLFEAGDFKIVALYHPAAVTYNPSMKEILKKDFEILKDLCQKI